MKPVVISTSAWQRIRAELHKEYPASVLALRSKMQRVLGFTVREHKSWIEKPREIFEKEYREYQINMDAKNDVYQLLDLEPVRGNSEYQIHLDFYSERKRTMFLLKFSEVIGKQDGEL
jgi:transcriptional regulatory protein LevR